MQARKLGMPAEVKVKRHSPPLQQSYVYKTIAALELVECKPKLRVVPASVLVFDGLTKGTGSIKKGTFEPGHPKQVGSYQPPSYGDDNFSGDVREPKPKQQQLNGNCRTASKNLRVRIVKPDEKARVAADKRTKLGDVVLTTRLEIARDIRDFDEQSCANRCAQAKRSADSNTLRKQEDTERRRLEAARAYRVQQAIAQVLARR